jgi:hypothetical protein
MWLLLTIEVWQQVISKGRLVEHVDRLVREFNCWLGLAIGEMWKEKTWGKKIDRNATTSGIVLCEEVNIFSKCCCVIASRLGQGKFPFRFPFLAGISEVFWI